MRTKIFFSLVLSVVLTQLYSQATRVLFVGNSYVATNNLPQTFYNLALSLGDTVYHDNHAPGGYTFQLHTTNATTLSKIDAQNWDYVILQAQSQEPSFSPAQVQANTYPYAKILDSLIHANNECTKTMFYMTWGRKYGDASNCPFYTPVCTFEGMNQRLRESYLEMSANNFAQTAPVGIAWRNARMADSTINLWSADNSHPSVAGTYLTACVFYASIFKQSPVGAPFMSTLGTGDAVFLQQIAAQTVLDSLDTWMLNQNPIHADYTYITNQLDINFTSDCFNATQYLWNFGDGNTSTQMNPSHSYVTAGNYNVQLIASNSCYADTITMSITVAGMAGIEEENAAHISIYPNPVKEIINIHSNVELNDWRIMDLNGKTILQGNMSSSILVSSLSEGVYILELMSKDRFYYTKFIK